VFATSAQRRVGGRSLLAVLRRAVLAVALVAALGVIVAPPAVADPASDKAKVDAELAQLESSLESATERAQTAALAYQQATLALPGAQAVLADARGRVYAAEAAQHEAQRQLTAANDVLKTASKSYDDAAARVEAARDRVGNFVSAAYKGSNLLALKAILDSGSPSAFSERLGYLDRLAAEEHKALDEVTAARQAARELQGVAEYAQKVADDAERVAAQTVDDARTAESAAARAAAEVQQLVDTAASAKTVADSERGAVLQRYSDAKAESDRIAQILRSPAGQGPGPPTAPNGPLLMPTAGWKSSDFGMRYDPYYQVWQLHAGVDIAAPGGQAIYAAAAGRVAYAGWNGGYGNYTCISHGQSGGRNLSTCYAHQSQIAVSVGQDVARGQFIGRVGTTGASTGSHLHFEVRLDGEPVNPLGWLPSCFC